MTIASAFGVASCASSACVHPLLHWSQYRTTRSTMHFVQNFQKIVHKNARSDEKSDTKNKIGSASNAEILNFYSGLSKRNYDNYPYVDFFQFWRMPRTVSMIMSQKSRYSHQKFTQKKETGREFAWMMGMLAVESNNNNLFFSFFNFLYYYFFLN